MGLFSRMFDPPIPQQGRMTRGPTLDRVTVHVTWATPEQIEALAPGQLAFCKGPQLLDDGWHAWITAPLPKDFNDFLRLKSLGHELFHSLGATHEERNDV